MSETQQADPREANDVLTAYQPSFSSGEIAPALWFRTDLAQQHSAVALLQNMIIQPQGNTARRPGTEYICDPHDLVGPWRLIPFSFNTEQQYEIEAGPNYFGFIFQGAPLLNGDGSRYIISTPYAGVDLITLRFVQSNDVLTIVHPSYPAMNLERLGALSWQLVAVTTGTQLAAPTGCAVTIDIGSGFTTAPAVLSYQYAVTACSDVTKDEGPLSNIGTAANYSTSYYSQYGVSNTINWSAVTGADFYKVYQLYQGVWSFVGSTTSLSFQDVGYAPDTAQSPPTGENPFAVLGNFGAVGYYQERRFFGGSLNNPDTIIGSKSGNYTNFDVSDPVRDDDAITFTLASRQLNEIRHFVPLADLIVFTGGGGFRVDGSKGAVSPSNFDTSPQTFPGCSRYTDPLVIGNYVLFVEQKGSSVRELVYNLYANSYVSEDRSVMANHLLKGHELLYWAYAETPDKVVWMVREDGLGLSLSYNVEQKIYAWARHICAGGFAAISAVTEPVYGGQGQQDTVYAIMGAANGMNPAIVRMRTTLLGPNDDDPRQAWYVDRGIQYVGAPTATVTGLGHLEGQTVSALADAEPISGLLVSGGAITLPNEASVITVGLPVPWMLTTLPLDNQHSIMGSRKNLSNVRLAVVNTAGVSMVSSSGGDDVVLPFIGQAGDDPNDLSDPIDPQTLYTGVIEALAPEGYDRLGQITLQGSGPQPVNIAGIRITYSVGA